ncbi:MAG: PTS glucose transporter subunit IIA [Micrococcaceae bacterium]
MTFVLAPCAGKVEQLADVPDPVFAQEMVGPGLAIVPVQQEQDVLSPVSGKISTLKPHAFVIETDEGQGILVHLGIDTVNLKGEGFTIHAEAEQTVQAGDKLITWNPAEIEKQGLSSVIPVIALESNKEDIVPTSELSVNAGDELYTIQ